MSVFPVDSSQALQQWRFIRIWAELDVLIRGTLTECMDLNGAEVDGLGTALDLAHPNAIGPVFSSDGDDVMASRRRTLIIALFINI